MKNIKTTWSVDFRKSLQLQTDKICSSKQDADESKKVCFLQIAK